MRFLIRAAVVLSLLLALPVWLIQPQPYDESALDSFLAPPEDCTAPCFMGLRPGSTTLDETIAILGAHPWVEDVVFAAPPARTPSSSNPNWLYWTWSDLRPAEIDASQMGRVDFTLNGRVHVVSNIKFLTRLPMPLLQDWFGHPHEGNVTRWNSGLLDYEIVYRNSRLGASSGVSTTMECPVNLLDYWYSQAEIVITIKVALVGGLYVPPTEAVHVC